MMSCHWNLDHIALIKSKFHIKILHHKCFANAEMPTFLVAYLLACFSFRINLVHKILIVSLEHRINGHEQHTTYAGDDRILLGSLDRIKEHTTYLDNDRIVLGSFQ